MSDIALVSLADVKAWVYRTPGGASSTNDDLLNQLIDRCSMLALNVMQRPTLRYHSVSELRDGLGNGMILLGEWPVLSMSSVLANGTSIAAGGATTGGWLLDPWNGYPPGNQQLLSYKGGRFPCGPQSLALTYTAGYTILDEADTVATGFVTVAQGKGPWVHDLGVKLANGTSLTKVASSPSASQYALDASATGKYLFNTSLNGAGVLISYDYTPFDVVQAVVEWIAERYAYMTRVGESMKQTGGQISVSYIVRAVPDFVKQALNQYMRVTMT